MSYLRVMKLVKPFQKQVAIMLIHMQNLVKILIITTMMASRADKPDLEMAKLVTP